MKIDDTIIALKMVTLALEEVQRFDGLLPSYEDPAESSAPKTFMELVKQYAGNRVPEAALVEVIAAVQQIVAPVSFEWK
ncbi:hypothetical protein [Pseudomonas grimontii]|uniref:hypothetical protein n=1 Tax=Pseudomonas grimontii TaxID=129847 RepID=UPI00387B0714